MPPLRERGRDVVLLAGHFLRTFSQEFRKPICRLSPAAEAALLAHGWPGNVRELRNVIERAVLLADHDVLEPQDFDALRGPGPAPDVRSAGPAGGLQLPPEGLHLDDLERDLIVLALERTRGNQTRAAALLGLHRDQIRYRMEKYGLTRPLSPERQ